MAFGLGNIPKSAPTPSKVAPHLDKRPIREKLLDWRPEPSLVQQLRLLPDSPLVAGVSNFNTKPHSTGSSELDYFKSTPEGMVDGAVLDGSEDIDAGVVSVNSRSPGDLVEMKQPGSRTPIFGIYLGYFGSRHHFYTGHGRWMVSQGFSAIFTVSKYASVAEIQPLLDAIPKHANPDDYQELRRADLGPSREAGAELIKKMNKFVADAEEHYQNSLSNLDKARSLVSDGKRTKYLSLFEMAEMLLPQSAREGNTFSPAALYAVHTALYRNEFNFRPLGPTSDCHRRDHLFEVFPYHDAMMVNRVAIMVREYAVTRGAMMKSPTYRELSESALGKFVLKAREVVKANREKRSFTPHGILAPSPAVTIEIPEWTRSHMDVIRFLEWWASYDLFEDGSRFHAYGSLILRALELYVDVPLNQTTAWTFLQEIGSVPSWEVPSRYKVRFPAVQIQSGGGLIRNKPMALEESLRPDIATGFRKEYKGVNVLCIDAPSTMIIDDGISLERTEKPDEFWIHIHTADPASGILPNSELATFLELIPENIYLPGHFQAMLPADIGVDSSNDYSSEGLTDRYSLAPGRPTLTFSAKVNEAGDILDYKIEPGVLDKVTYLDPKDVSQFCQEPAPPPVPEQSLVVGTLPSKDNQPPNRPMMAAEDLDSGSKQDLLSLYRLAEAIKGKRLEKGAWPYFAPRPSVTVAFEEVPVDEVPKEGVKVLPPDPYIKVDYDAFNGASVVSNTMVLAGEIAARWCADRGIAIPYRKNVHSSRFEEIYEYATKELYPSLRQGIQPSSVQRQELNRLTGDMDISTTPGPYFMLGLDMYAKATSPLRRFSDLIVHWQVHAALAHEREVNRKLDASVDNLDEILPFTLDHLENTLSLLHMREKMAKVLSYGAREWMLMALVRDWKFENRPPRQLRFTVDSTWAKGLMGRIDLFDLDAIMTVDGMDALVLLVDVKVGDEFEVELADINVHQRHIFVKAIRYMGHSEKTALAP
ncbi:hypothetical protein BGZ63DRAFT_346540 [Mariannaea sp. PMI_226]|nr:hypothetical protein BGZ63DRAFT_346540 [Mariannaea sp. PMI_226]